MSADHLGYLGAFLALAAALATVRWMAPWFGVREASDRYAAIDGARGLAAFFVFICHAAAWYYYAKTGKWAHYPVRGYGNFGQVSVVVFFMITAFLFLSKLMHAGPKGVDWMRMLVSRVLRLYPLYLFAMAVVLLIVGVETGFRLAEPGSSLLSSVGHWLLFTAWGAPDLNGMKDTWLIIAGVTWSLPYEVFFYFLLPVLGVAARVPASLLLVGVCTAIAGGLFVSALTPLLALPFLGGAVATLLSRQARFRQFAQTPWASLTVLIALAIATGLYWTAFKAVPLILVSLAFALIASGTTVFGVLSSRSARLLGEVSYSMYLLHGVLLFCLVRWVLGPETIAGMAPAAYWGLIIAMAPIVVAACLLTFSTIERPAMNSVDAVVAAVRRRSTQAALPGQ